MPKDTDMPKYAPKIGDTIHTADGSEFICDATPCDVQLGYTGSTIYGRFAGLPGWQVWNDEGLPVKYDGTTNPHCSLRIVAITPAAGEAKPPKFSPQPWDTIITRDRGAWTCCTQEFLQQTFGLATSLLIDRLFAFRVDDKNHTGVIWMSWPQDPANGDEGFQIIAVTTAKCNRPAIRDTWNREALINYIKTLPDQFTIDKDGHIE